MFWRKRRLARKQAAPPEDPRTAAYDEGPESAKRRYEDETNPQREVDAVQSEFSADLGSD